MNKIGLIGLVLFICSVIKVSAQEKGINFEKEGTTFKMAQQKALKENKLIFLDCYTSWCGPCKKMANEVFPLETVGNFMNDKYISIKIDMEKGEGPELLKKFQVSAFPTFIIFDGRGNEIGRFLGGANAEVFVEKVTAASIDNTSAEMDKRFESGERSAEFLYEYLKTLSSAYKREQCSVVAEALLEGKEKTFISDAKLADVFMKNLQNPFNPAFIAVAKNPEALGKAINNSKAVEMKLNNVWRTYPKTLVSQENGVVNVNMAKFEAFVQLMNECKVLDKETIKLESQMHFAEKQENWSDYTKSFVEFYNNKNLYVTDLNLCKWATPIVTKCTDSELRKEVEKLLQDRVSKLKSGEVQPQTQQGAMKLSGNMQMAMEKLIEVLNQ